MGSKTAPSWTPEEVIPWKDCFSAFGRENGYGTSELETSGNLTPSLFYRWAS